MDESFPTVSGDNVSPSRGMLKDIQRKTILHHTLPPVGESIMRSAGYLLSWATRAHWELHQAEKDLLNTHHKRWQLKWWQKCVLTVKTKFSKQREKSTLKAPPALPEAV